MQQRVVEVEIERPLRLDAPLQEGDGASLVLDVDIYSQLFGERLVVELPDAGCPRSLVHVRPEITLRAVPGIVEPPALVVRARRAVPLVEPVVGRPPAVLRPEMPFPEARGCVPRVRQDVGNRPFPGDQPLAAAVSRDGVRPGSDRVASRHQCRARRRALRLGDVVPQLQALSREVVRAFRLRTTHDAAAVASKLPHPQVVDVEEEDVRRWRGQVDPSIAVDEWSQHTTWFPARSRAVTHRALPKMTANGSPRDGGGGRSYRG